MSGPGRHATAEEPSATSQPTASRVKQAAALFGGSSAGSAGREPKLLTQVSVGRRGSGDGTVTVVELPSSGAAPVLRRGTNYDEHKGSSGESSQRSIRPAVPAPSELTQPADPIPRAAQRMSPAAVCGNASSGLPRMLGSAALAVAPAGGPAPPLSGETSWPNASHSAADSKQPLGLGRRLGKLLSFGSKAPKAHSPLYSHTEDVTSAAVHASKRLSDFGQQLEGTGHHHFQGHDQPFLRAAVQSPARPAAHTPLLPQEDQQPAAAAPRPAIAPAAPAEARPVPLVDADQLANDFQRAMPQYCRPRSISSSSGGPAGGLGAVGDAAAAGAGIPRLQRGASVDGGSVDGGLLKRHNRGSVPGVEAPSSAASLLSGFIPGEMAPRRRQLRAASEDGFTMGYRS